MVNITFANPVSYKQDRKQVWLDLISDLTLYLLLVLILTIPSNAFASDGYASGQLTDLFSTDSFTGNWEILTKMGWLGQAMSLIISVFSFIGLFTVGLRMMMTILYLSGKNLWDNVDEIKSVGKGKGMFGIPELFNAAKNAKYGTGLDAVVSFLLSLLPNIKGYSEYSTDAKHKYNYAETDTVAQYLLKSAIPNVMIIFAFTMGFNGTLWKAYGTVVEALGIVSENFVDSNLSGIVDKALNTGSSYKFAYSADGTKYGDFKQSVMKKIYSSVLKHSTDWTTDDKIQIGKNIDAKMSDAVDAMASIAALSTINDDMSKTFTYLVESGRSSTQHVTYTDLDFTWSKGKIKVKYTTTGSGNKEPNASQYALAVSSIADSQAKNLEYSVVVNNTESYTGALSVPAEDLGLSSPDSEHPIYIHLFISKKADSNEHDYLSVGGGDD